MGVAVAFFCCSLSWVKVVSGSTKPRLCVKFMKKTDFVFLIELVIFKIHQCFSVPFKACSAIVLNIVTVSLRLLFFYLEVVIFFIINNFRVSGVYYISENDF